MHSHSPTANSEWAREKRPFEVALHFIKTTPPVGSLITFSPEVTCWLSYHIYNFRLEVEKVLMFVSWLYSCSYDVCCVAGSSSRWHPDSRPAGGYRFQRLSLHVQPALSSRWSRDGCNSQSKVSFSHIVATILTYDNLYLQYINVSMFSSSCG